MITLVVFLLLVLYGVNAWAGRGAGASWREVNVIFLKILGVAAVLVAVVALLMLIIHGMEKGVLP